MAAIFGSQPVQSILHDSVFTKMDAASKLFNVLVLKTNKTIPYSSNWIVSTGMPIKKESYA